MRCDLTLPWIAEDAAHQLQPEDPRGDGDEGGGERRMRQQRREQEQGQWATASIADTYHDIAV